MSRLTPRYDMPAADVGGAFRNLMEANKATSAAMDGFGTKFSGAIDDLDKRAYTKQVGDVLASGDPRKMMSVDFTRLTPEAATSVQQRMAMAEHGFKLDERDRMLNGRTAMDIYNKNQTPQQLAAATLAVEQDKGARDRVDALSFTPEELAAQEGLKYTDEAELERSLLAGGVDPLMARAIRDKARLQRTLGEEVNKVAPTYESEIMARQRAYEQAVKAGGGVVPAAMAADLRSARAADEQVRISKREALLKQIESVDKDMRKSELAATKEGVRVGEKSGGSSGKSKTLMGSPEVGVAKFMDELKKEVSNFGIGMDANKVETAAAKMKALGFSEDQQKYVLSNLTRDGLLETYVVDPTDEQIVELGRAYDNAVAKGGGGNTAYARALQGDVADLQATKQSLMNQLKAVDADPMAARIANARAAILGVGEVPKVAPTRTETGAPKTEVKKPSGAGADVFEQMTPVQQAEVEKQSLIAGTKGQFDALYNKPDKTREDWKTLEELGKELDVLTGRVSDYVPINGKFDLSRAGTQDPESIGRDEEPLDALANRIKLIQEAFSKRGVDKPGMEMGPTLEENWKIAQEDEMRKLINNVQGKRTGFLSYPSATEVKEARSKLREMYLMNPTRFQQLYGPKVVDAIYR